MTDQLRQTETEKTDRECWVGEWVAVVAHLKHYLHSMDKPTNSITNVKQRIVVNSSDIRTVFLPLQILTNLLGL